MFINLYICSIQSRSNHYNNMFGFLKNLMGGGDSANLEQLIKDGALIVDVRTPQEFAGGHAKGAINIPLDQIPNSLQQLKDKKHIIVCCRSGARSGQAQQFLVGNGFTNVTNGGAWNNVSQYIP